MSQIDHTDRDQKMTLRLVQRSEEAQVYEALKQARDVPGRAGVLMCHWVGGRLICHVQQKLKPTG